MKSSFGTALKLFGHGWWSNVSAFGKLALLTFLIVRQPDVTNLLHPQDSALAGQKAAEAERISPNNGTPPLTNLR